MRNAASLLLLVLLTTALAAAPKASPFKTTGPKEHVEKVTTPRKAYEIRMGGTADMDNTLTRSCWRFDIAFQPNLSLEIENTGDTPVVNPRVVTNGKRRWWCIEEMAKEATAGARNDQEKAMLIWDFVRKNRVHYYHFFHKDIGHLNDPVCHLNIYGQALCGTNGHITGSLFMAAGLNKKRLGKGPKLRCMNGHVQIEAFVDGGYQFLDTDVDAFYLDRENEKPVSGDAIGRDHDLGRRVHSYGPRFRHWFISHHTAGLMGRDDFFRDDFRSGYRMDLTLRPGEKVVYRWDNIGKLAYGEKMRSRFNGTGHPSPRHGRPSYFGNSYLVYTPRLDPDLLRPGAAKLKDVVSVRTPAGPAAAGATRDAFVVYEMRTPYTVCGGSVKATFTAERAQDRFALSLSLDGKRWTKPLWTAAGKGTHPCEIELDKHMRLDHSPAKRRFFVKVGLSSAAPRTARLAALTLRMDFLASPVSLPRLSLGVNKVEYFDDNKAGREVTLRHRWRESGNLQPPPPPAAPTFPKPDAVVRKTRFRFQWPQTPGADRYRVQVSKYPDFRIPYMPTFDLIVKTDTFGSPYAGLFSPDVDYYWRVRARREGLWGPWSPTWRFRWDGPRVPVGLKTVRDGRRFTLTWKPNPRGPRPVAYDVYGSTERGFSISKVPYVVVRLNRQRRDKPNTPPNFIGRTTATRMVVVDAACHKPNTNVPFFRVTAVDKNGTESGTSDFVEAPHPFVYSAPVTAAVVGRPYRYAMRTLRSIGDLQARTRHIPRYAFREKEGYEWTLTEGPKWLRCDKATGVLSGAPGPGDMGKARVVVTVKRTYPHEVAPEKRWMKLRFWDTKQQASATHAFEIDVRPAAPK